MGALIASPEAGGSLVNVKPQMKKYSAITDDHSKSFISTMSERGNDLHRSLIRPTNFNSVNGVNKREYDGVLLMHKCACDEISNSTLHEDCQFPYYRSSKCYRQCSDTVLVKDVGVSCTLLSQDSPKIPVPEAKNYLLKQLRREYNDLSNITNKITAYTKDILNHLSKRHQKNRGLAQNLVSSKHAIAYQYVDSKGNVCLKLRLLSNTETQCSNHHIVEKPDNTTNDGKNVVEESNNEYSEKQIVDHIKREKEVQTLFIGEKTETSTSSFSSQRTSSIYDYLTTRKKKSSNEMLKSTLMSSYKNNNRKEHYKRSNPVVFTNWKEISKSKRLKKNVPPTMYNKSRETIEIKGTSSQAQSFNSRIHNILNTRFHTVNIRIIKHTKKQA